jgi:stage IV sporulation protein FB
MSWTFTLGQIFGSEVRVHATFFLLLAWIGISAYLSAGLAAGIGNVIFVLALFACVVLHEFGHALAARRYGIRTPDITLLPIGGMARLERMPADPREEIIVALAGPAVNLCIWLVLIFVIGVSADMLAVADLQEPAQSFWSRLAAVNLFLALFNLIPAFPMDGGRVLRAVLSFSIDRPRATAIAARAGQAVAFLFAFWGLTSGNLVLLLIAVFIFLAAAAESSDVMMRARTHDVPARDAMITQFEVLAPDATVDAAAHALVRTTQAEFPVVDPDKSLLGFLTRAQIVSAMHAHQAGSPVADHMTTAIPSVALESSLESVVDLLNAKSMPAVAITDPRDRFLGYITRENLGEWLLFHQKG